MTARFSVYNHKLFPTKDVATRSHPQDVRESLLALATTALYLLPRSGSPFLWLCFA